ncbi:protein-glutamate O-methyltransferase family protein [Streptomyces bauhiniae]|uniref:Protein-glutamate O-methyltransferase family protein n=1 Tax=Streptomyces bauhiniae TaxID=2340725 RepID=A0A4Z1D3F1_9ACTN|nr:damage-control phosphatase ARMT1 family protein [Streptomyces bauhiniae]TGN76600.1 protein-glutamate O-methyltransferase family protein [Streptomyces bauhiniae]
MSDAAPTAPVIRADEPGSFPHRTLAERHPAIIRQVREGLPYEPPQQRALDALLKNCTEGVIEPLPADAPDRARWQSWGMDTYAGQSWFDVPWLWAESYFYRRLLGAVGWFGPGAWRGIDPFRPSKTGELHSAETDAELSALDELRDSPADERNCALLSGSLWGNRADLSFRLSSEGGERREAAPGLVADDSDLLWSLLPPGGTGTLCLVADNAGRELVPDLLLIAALLTEPRIGRAVLHLKPTPYYVSDATTADVLDALHRLRSAGGLAGEYGDTLWSALGDGRLVLRAHPFSCSPLPYADMPDDLRADFAAAGLTLFKGDLNYRRLVGDRYWPATTPFAEVTAYFPGPVAALRTLKSEVITGLSASTEAALDKAEGRKWLTSGTHALIQVNPSTGPDGQ